MSTTEDGIGVPCAPQDHEDGSRNYGYCDLKNHPETIGTIPELRDFPELQRFVKSVNVSNSLFRTLGCEKSFHDSDTPIYKRKLVSYVDLAFEILKFNGSQKAFEHLFEWLRTFAAGWPPSEAVGIEFEIGPASYNDHHFLGWRVSAWNYGYGQNDSEARESWKVGLGLLQKFLENESSRFSHELHRGEEAIS